MKLDCRSEVCPYPILRAVEAMKKTPPEAIEVLTDHAPTLETIPTQAERMGFSVKIEQTGNPEWKITLTPQPKEG